MRLLLVEKNQQTAIRIKRSLKKTYVIDVSDDLIEVEELIDHHSYDVLILDFESSSKNDICPCVSLRERGIRVPILMLSSCKDVAKKVAMLDGGADDCLVKPFEVAELEARIRVLLRRKIDHPNSILKVDDLILDVSKHIVRRGDNVIYLRRKELAVLEYLMRNVERVVSRDMILNNVWNQPENCFYNIVDVHIKYLRDRVDRQFEKKLIKTVPGHGYKIES